MTMCTGKQSRTVSRPAVLAGWSRPSYSLVLQPSCWRTNAACVGGGMGIDSIRLGLSVPLGEDPNS